MNANSKTLNIKLYLLLFVAGAVSTLFILYKINAIAEETKVTTHRHQLYKTCVENAGNYVFRRVEGVKGVAQLRLREWGGMEIGKAGLSIHMICMDITLSRLDMLNFRM